MDELLKLNNDWRLVELEIFWCDFYFKALNSVWNPTGISRKITIDLWLTDDFIWIGKLNVWNISRTVLKPLDHFMENHFLATTRISVFEWLSTSIIPGKYLKPPKSNGISTNDWKIIRTAIIIINSCWQYQYQSKRRALQFIYT